MIVSISVLKEQLNISVDDGSDDAFLMRKLSAAQEYIERQIGFKIERTYGGEGQDPVPALLIEAVCQLAAHWYENREVSVVGMGVSTLPFGVQDIIREYRTWSF